MQNHEKGRSRWIEKQGKLSVRQRTRHQTMPLKWEFPGGKIEEGEQPRDALRRELEEELGIHAKVGDEISLACSMSIPTAPRLNLDFLSCANTTVKLKTASFAICSGPPPNALPSYDFLEADASLVKDLAAGKLPDNLNFNFTR